MHNVQAIVGLIALAIAGATLAHRLRTPAPSLLVLVGLAVGFLPGLPDTQVSPQLVTIGVLPPLLFAAAQQVSLVDLRHVWKPVALLASALVAVTAAAVAGLTHLVDGSIGIAVAFTLGAVLASTDPVAVTALSRELRLPERIGTLVQSESLFNDATSLVLFQVAVTAVTSGGMDPGAAVVRFIQLGGGGAALGVAVGAVVSLLLRRGGDATMLAAMALVTPYVAAVSAEAAHVSSVTAVIFAGLMVAERRAHGRQPSGRLQAGAVYDTVVFVLENAIFAVIGLQLATFIGNLPSGEGAHAAVLAVVVIAVLLAVRGLAMGAAAVLVARRGIGPSGDASYRPWQAAAVVTWAGARGVVPLAAALSIPLTVDSGSAFPHRPLLLVVSTAAVVATLVVQGTTLQPLVRRLGVIGDPGVIAVQRDRARHALAAAALSNLADAAAAVEAPDDVVERTREELQRRADHTRRRLRAEDPEPAGGGSYRDLRRRLVDAEARELARLRGAGEISAEVFRELQRQLDLEAARLA